VPVAQLYFSFKIFRFFQFRFLNSCSNALNLRGEAIDMRAPAGARYTTADIFRFIRKNCEFDQLIWEFGNDQNPDWIHVSFSLGRNNRKEVLRATKVGGRTVYNKMT